MCRHPFAGSSGTKRRDGFAAALYVEQDGRCAMCGQAVDATLRGKKTSTSAVVDHTRPWRLRPDLALDGSNLRLVCRRCHASCDSIEKRLWPDAEAIAARKLSVRPVGLDGYPLARSFAV